MPEENNNKKVCLIDNVKKKCVELWKLIVGIGVIIGLIAGFYGLDAVVATEKDLDIHKKDIIGKLENLETEVISSLQQFQKQQDLQFWNQRYQEYLDRETDFRYKLKRDPNNQDLKAQYEYWKQKRIEAQKKIDELTKPTPPTGG